MNGFAVVKKLMHMVVKRILKIRVMILKEMGDCMEDICRICPCSKICTELKYANESEEDYAQYLFKAESCKEQYNSSEF